MRATLDMRGRVLHDASGLGGCGRRHALGTGLGQAQVGNGIAFQQALPHAPTQPAPQDGRPPHDCGVRDAAPAQNLDPCSHVGIRHAPGLTPAVNIQQRLDMIAAGLAGNLRLKLPDVAIQQFAHGDAISGGPLLPGAPDQFLFMGGHQSLGVVELPGGLLIGEAP